MKPPEHSLGAHGLIILDKSSADTRFGEIICAVGLHKPSAGVTVHSRYDYPESLNPACLCLNLSRLNAPLYNTVQSPFAISVRSLGGYCSRLRTCYELIYTSCLSGFPISSSESLAVPRYGCVFFLDLKKPSCAICIVNFVTAPKLQFLTRYIKVREELHSSEEQRK